MKDIFVSIIYSMFSFPNLRKIGQIFSFRVLFHLKFQKSNDSNNLLIHSRIICENKKKCIATKITFIYSLCHKYPKLGMFHKNTVIFRDIREDKKFEFE